MDTWSLLIRYSGFFYQQNNTERLLSRNTSLPVQLRIKWNQTISYSSTTVKYHLTQSRQHCKENKTFPTQSRRHCNGDKTFPTQSRRHCNDDRTFLTQSRRYCHDDNAFWHQAGAFWDDEGGVAPYAKSAYESRYYYGATTWELCLSWWLIG